MEVYLVKTSSTLPLGKQGENLARQIQFDLSLWISSFGPGTVQLLHQREGDEAPYPVAVEQAGNLAVWTVTNADTASAGTGRAELQYYVGDALAKSETWMTKVLTALGPAGETPPEAQQGWVDQVLAQAARITGMTAQGVELPAGSAPTAEYADGVLTIGIPLGGDVSEAQISRAVAEYLLKNPVAETDPTVPDWAKEEKKPFYTAAEVGADPSGTAASQVSAHNTETTAHSDIRLLIQGLTDRLNALADSDDTTLDQLSEIVSYIKSNRNLIAAVTTDKVSVTDIVNDLVTNVASKPLSAAKGVALKELIDALSEAKVALPKDEDGNIIPGTPGWYAVSDGTGGITWVEYTPSTGDDSGDGEGDSGDTGGDTGGEALDTSPIIEISDVALDKNGNTTESTGMSVTKLYDLDKTYTSGVAVNLKYRLPGSGTGYLQLFNDGVFKTYYSVSYGESENFVTLNGGYGPFNQVRFALSSDGLDDCYAYLTTISDDEIIKILFAGKNTDYYGSGSDSGSVVSVAAEVDNQVAMLSLSTGESVDTSAYSGLSSDYVAMVQANYDAMMAECLGDYNKIPLIVHTDQHGRIGASNQVMKLIGDMTNWYEISKCINLGDTVADRFDTIALENYLSATKDSIPLSKRLDVYGNHDVWDNDEDQKYTVDQKHLSPYFKNIYARRHSNNGYFTVVDDYYNVKYLVVSDLEYPDTNYSTRRITTAQAEFIVSELSADDGRDIVLVAHVPLDSDEATSRDSTYLAYSEKFLSSSTAHDSFMTMLAARKNKTSGTFTDSEGVEHAYDFSNVSGNLLMSLHGHAHFEAYRTFENSITEFIFDWFDGNTFYFAYIDRGEKKFKVWKNEADVAALEISIA